MDDEKVTRQYLVTDEDIQALADGGLDGEEKNTVLSAVIRSPELMARYQELRNQKDAIRQWWQKFHKEH